MEIYYNDLQATYTPALEPVVLAEGQTIWTGPAHSNKDRAAERAMQKVTELQAEPCVHCGRQADFIEVTEWHLAAWCSIYEAEAFYKGSRI